MGDSMKEAFKKSGFKSPERKPERHTSRPNSTPTKTIFRLEKNYTAQAEQVIRGLRSSMGRDYQQFTTSKIRNILAKVSELYNEVTIAQQDILSSEIQSKIEYLKVRLVYECGRELYVIKPFVEKAGLLDLLNAIGDDRQRFIDFAHYMEALVAYHRFHGGKD
ncbi:type III-A CRISPR-associated protein Csm2 [Desulfoscipio gibsoniae]